MPVMGFDIGRHLYTAAQTPAAAPTPGPDPTPPPTPSSVDSPNWWDSPPADNPAPYKWPDTTNSPIDPKYNPLDPLAQAKAYGDPGTSGGGYDANQLRQALLSHTAPASAASLQAFIAAHPEFATGVTIGGSKANKLYGPGGQFLADVINGTSGPNPSWAWDTSVGSDAGGGQSYTGPGGGVGYANPSSQLFLNEALSRLQALHQPVSNPFQDAYLQQALKRVADLQQAPYTPADEAALIAQFREPLTHARDAALQRRTEQMGARGIGPTSGLFQDQINQVENTYQQGIAQGANQLGVTAVAEKQRRAQEALAVLTDMLGVTNTSQQQDQQRQQETLQVAALFPQFDAHQLQQLLAASGGGTTSPSDLVSMVTQIGNLNLNQQNQANASKASSSAAWGQLLGYLLNQSGKAA